MSAVIVWDHIHESIHDFCINVETYKLYLTLHGYVAPTPKWTSVDRRRFVSFDQ